MLIFIKKEVILKKLWILICSIFSKKNVDSTNNSNYELDEDDAQLSDKLWGDYRYEKDLFGFNYRSWSKETAFG